MNTIITQIQPQGLSPSALFPIINEDCEDEDEEQSPVLAMGKTDFEEKATLWQQQDLSAKSEQSAAIKEVEPGIFVLDLAKCEPRYKRLGHHS